VTSSETTLSRTSSG